MANKSRKLLIEEQPLVAHINGVAFELNDCLIELDAISEALGSLQPFASRKLEPEKQKASAQELRARARQLVAIASEFFRLAGSYDGAALVGRSVTPSPNRVRRAAKAARVRGL